MENLTFRSYCPSDLNGCLALFDQNCPEFFAVNERLEYETYLASCPSDYMVGQSDTSLVAAFGLTLESGSDPRRCRVNWIMVSPSVHGSGVGSKMMGHVVAIGKEKKVSIIDIAASHLSSPFFAKFGAKVVNTTKDGWGAGMHRIDMALSL